MGEKSLGLAVGIGALCASLMGPAMVGAGEPAGFRDRPWGARWDASAIGSLPGCEGQGELVVDVEGYVARVAQPECVGYRFSAELRVNLILFYPEIKWHSLDRSRLVVDNLLSLRRIWGLHRETVADLERFSARLAALSPLRGLYGGGRPVFPDMSEAFQLPDSGRGLQGYQVTFPQHQYDAMKSALLSRLAPPTRQTLETASGEVLEWTGNSTHSVLKTGGGADGSGYFFVVTKRCVNLPVEGERSPEMGLALRPNLMSYPWFIQLVEGFEWARHW
jgi:hypothetical protein